MKKNIEELQAIKAEKENKKQLDDAEKLRVALSIELGFCPECGAEIIEQRGEPLPIVRKYLWGLITIDKINWDFRNVCPVDKHHYELKYNHENY